jgi:hypothetical protein
MKAAAFALALLAAPAAQAAPDTLALYQAGKYDQAIASGTHDATALGYATAARAALADAMLKSPCLECLKRAADLSHRSIAADPKLSDAYVYLAVSLGYQGRIIGPIRAQLDGYPEEAKRNLDEALLADPKNAWALAALGGWNIEIVRGGGVNLARWLYGASLEAGMKAFDAAFRVQPDNLVLRYQYALSLAGLDLGEWQGQVETTLERAATARANTAYELFAQGRARELLTALRNNDREAFGRLVRRDQGYP